MEHQHRRAIERFEQDWSDYFDRNNITFTSVLSDYRDALQMLPAEKSSRLRELANSVLVRNDWSRRKKMISVYRMTQRELGTAKWEAPGR